MFAPTDDAFAKIPSDTLNGLLADKAMLTKMLTHHVVAGKLSPDQLAGTHKTLAGDTIKVDGLGRGLHRRRRERQGAVRQHPDRERHRVRHRHRAGALTTLSTRDDEGTARCPT